MLRWLVLLLTVASFFTLQPLWVSLVLAAWIAIIARPLHRLITRWMGNAVRSAGVTTVLLVLVTLTPVALVVLSLASDAISLAERLSQSDGMRDALAVFISNDATTTPQDGLVPYFELARRHGSSALDTVSKVAGATTTAVISIVVFVYGFYAFLVHGQRASDWLSVCTPLRSSDVRRFGAVFEETGRGLMIGVGLTAVLQAIVATLGYLAVGLPHALVLGLLTLVTGLIPAIGTGLVWVPISIALYLGGRPGAAIFVLGVGLFISIADNFVRPWLSRHARLKLPTFVLFVAMLGGIIAFGPWGLILGPLFVRMTIEGVAILREHRLLGRVPSSQRPSAAPPSPGVTCDSSEPAARCCGSVSQLRPPESWVDRRLQTGS
jgi:predicted PurR-regulated permease PerM